MNNSMSKALDAIENLEKVLDELMESPDLELAHNLEDPLRQVFLACRQLDERTSHLLTRLDDAQAVLRFANNAPDAESLLLAMRVIVGAIDQAKEVLRLKPQELLWLRGVVA